MMLLIFFLIVLLSIYMIRNPLNNDGALMQLYDSFTLPERPQIVKNTHWYQHTFNRPRRNTLAKGGQGCRVTATP